jgi:hypothetical protein
MEWRVTIELSCADGTKQIHDVARGGWADPHSTFGPLGLTLDDGKALLALMRSNTSAGARARRHDSETRTGARAWRLWHGQTARALRLIQRTLGCCRSEGGGKNRGGQIGDEADEGIGRAGDLRVRPRRSDHRLRIGEAGRRAVLHVANGPAPRGRCQSNV